MVDSAQPNGAFDADLLKKYAPVGPIKIGSADDADTIVTSESHGTNRVILLGSEPLGPFLYSSVV